MEGWELGKTKVFLKYYNEEFLARYITFLRIKSHDIVNISNFIVNLFNYNNVRLQIVRNKSEKNYKSAMHDESFLGQKKGDQE